MNQNEKGSRTFFQKDSIDTNQTIMIEFPLSAWHKIKFF